MNKKNNILHWSNDDYFKFLSSMYMHDVIGIFKNEFLVLPTYQQLNKLKIVSLRLPYYERVIYSDDVEISYHLSGYSNDVYDALFRLFGESAERYSAIMSSLIYQSEIIPLNLISNINDDELLPIDLINIYTDDQRDKMHKISCFLSKYQLKNQREIKLIKSLNYKNNKNYYLPYQAIFMSGNVIDKITYIPSFTTGTATHVTAQKAMINAITEVFQIHNFMEFWYFTNNGNLLYFNDIKNHIDYFKNKDFNFDVNFIYINSKNTKLYTIVCFIINDQFPYYSCGVQSGFDLNDTFIRAFEECFAIFQSSSMKQIYEVNDDNKIDKIDKNNIIDLDKNVYFWALNYQNEPKEYYEKNIANLKTISYEFLLNKQLNFNNDDKKILRFLSKEIKDISDYIFIKEITAPEFIDNYYVCRFYVPDLFSLFLPSFPPLNHKYIKKNNLEIKKDYLIHPLP